MLWGVWLAILVVGVVVMFERLRTLERRVGDGNQAVEAIRVRLLELERELAAGARSVAASPESLGATAPVSEPAPAAVVPPAVAAPVPARLPVLPPVEVPPAPVIPPAPVLSTPLPTSPDTVPPIPVNEPAPVDWPMLPGGESAAPMAPPADATDRVRPAVAPPREPPPTGPVWGRIDWENLVGVQLFSWIAGIALVFAAVFFLRYSIEHGWLSPTIRMTIGLVVGSGTLVFCELRAARRYPVTANALDAAGVAILFATLFASYALWHLLPQVPVFLLMSLVTAVAVLLSIRRDSLFIALLGLVGGFATPALLSAGDDRPIALFSYLLLLNAGLAWLAYRKRWLMLTALSVAFTAFYQWAWVLKFLDASRLPLAMSIFAIFPALHFSVLYLGRRTSSVEPLGAEFERVGVAAAGLPILFALYLGAIPGYGTHYVMLFGFLLLTTGGLTAIAVQSGWEALYRLALGSTLLVFGLWFALSYEHAAWPGILGVLAVFVLFHIAVAAIARWRRQMEVALFAGRGASWLLVGFPLLVVIEPATQTPGLLFGVLLALAGVFAAVAILGEYGELHLLVGVFVLMTEAVWSAARLTPEHLWAALALYAVVALFHLAMPLVAERLGKRLEPQGSGAIVLLVSLALLLFLVGGSMAGIALWGVAVLLALFNGGLLVEAAQGHLPPLSIVGAVLSWLVLGVWWSNALEAARLISALTVVGGFTLFLLAGHLWVWPRSAANGDERARRLVRNVPALALVAYLFLLHVASVPSLALPPWPLFATLGLLTLACATASLYQRDAMLFLAASVASTTIVGRWILVGHVPPWPLVGIAAVLTLAEGTLVWVPLARRRGAVLDGFARVAVVTALLGQCVVVVASQQPGPLLTVWVASAQIALLSGLFFVGAHTWLQVAVLAVVPTSVQSLLWVWSPHLRGANWAGHLLFAASLYVPFLVNPLWLGARAGRSRSPYLAAVLMSGVFFAAARRCLSVGGMEGVMGALPVAQALCMLALLVRLLRVEPPPNRHQGRLALVAGAALAFITVAIPLQLDRQWITIGWALEGAALAWLYRRIPHRGVLAWAAGLCAAVFVRLCANPAVFTYHPRGALPVFNWYLYTYLVSAAAFVVAARWLRGTDEDVGSALHAGRPLRVSAFLVGAATVILFLLLNIEIADFYARGPTLTFDFSAGLAQDLTYTLGWALFAIGMLTAGINGVSRTARIASLALLVVTILKCFLHDLWRLGGLYRVGSFVGLAMCLALVAVLLQRFVLGGQKEAA